jgi:ubiquinone/menaquinone biosynthesis C-methylase UbiE
MRGRDSDYFQELQTKTGWSRTLYGFALWCSPESGWHTLDVGCGPGLLPAIFSKFGCRSVGVDLELEMFRPSPLHSKIVVANTFHLPFKSQSFDLLTASNLIFLLSEPARALEEMKRVLRPGGKLAMLNPSEHLNDQSALDYAVESSLDGVARETLLNWARRAIENHHWTEEETIDLYKDAGMKYMASALKVGPGFGRFSWGMA